MKKRLYVQDYMLYEKKKNKKERKDICQIGQQECVGNSQRITKWKIMA